MSFEPCIVLRVRGLRGVSFLSLGQEFAAVAAAARVFFFFFRERVRDLRRGEVSFCYYSFSSACVS